METGVENVFFFLLVLKKNDTVSYIYKKKLNRIKSMFTKNDFGEDDQSAYITKYILWQYGL